MNFKSILKAAIVTLILSPNLIFGQTDKVQLNKWITDWNLLGPLPLGESTNESIHLPGFEKDFLEKIGGESNPKIKVEQTIKVDNSKLKWINHNGADSIINLDEAISKRSYVAAYAYKEIISDKEGIYIFSLGSNDGGRLWINGTEVWDYPGARACTPDADLIPVYFKKGINKVLIKVEERGNSWGFCARILPFNIDTFTKNKSLFKVASSSEGGSELRFFLSEAASNNLFNEVDIEIYADDNRKQPFWSGVWNRKAKMPLKSMDQAYRPYTLKIIANTKDDRVWEDEIAFYSGKRIYYSLFENGKTDYKIVIGTDASESEQWAATELQKSLMEISGINFEIINDDEPITDKELIIGYNKHSQELLGSEFTAPELMDESFFYKNIESNIVMLGGKQRGTMYAVFSYLEKNHGVRWYAPKMTVFPKRGKFGFDYLYHHDKPTLQVRNDFYYEAFDPTWAAHNKINGAMGYRQQHGDIEGYWSVHTFFPLMPPSEFYDKHPEYYSLIDGKRVHDNAQLCLTNPNVLDIITTRLKVKMRENPSNLIYSISQNDWRNPCQCDNCQKIAKEEESEAGVMVWFVNQVADRVKDEFPNKYVGTLAYQYTRKPPKNIVPRENVVIRFCSIECCFAHDFKSCPENQQFLADLEGWSAISPHLYIWDYVVNFTHYIMPYPNFNVLQPNIKTFLENKSIGIMEQAAYQSRGGEFAELRSYLLSKLLWNDDSNVDEVIDDFMYGYYGRSGQFIREYFDLLHDQVTPDTHIHLGLTPEDKIFSEKFIQEADRIFDKAERVSENKDMLERVEMARLPLMYLKCRRNPSNAKYDGSYDRLLEIAKREGITHFAESGKPQFDAFKELMDSIE